MSNVYLILNIISKISYFDYLSKNPQKINTFFPSNKHTKAAN